MNCEKCGKNRASIHKILIINGNRTEYNLCHVCANKENFQISGIQDPFYMMNKFLDNNFYEFEDVDDMSNYFRIDNKNSSLIKKDRYTENISDLFTKKLDSKEKKSDIDILKEKLKKAVEVEDYEGAAVIRDKIKLKNKEN